jgi:hypothetical protein
MRNGGSRSPRMDYHNLFSHSTSSRWWNRESIQLLWPQTSAAFLCLWLDWDQRWVAWKLSDGNLINASNKQIGEWNAEGRRRSIHEFVSGEATSAECSFLGRLQIKEDRQLIERWLSDTQFSAGNRQSSSSDNASVHFVLTASSHRREKADKILARWDGVKATSGDGYTFLGTVQCVLSLPASPAKTDGFLRIQLVPDGESLQSWNTIVHTHHLVADLQWQRPTSFSSSGISDLPLGTNVEFAIYGVTPGSYRLQALWDRQKPFCSSTNRICDPTRGDVVSTSSPLVRVRKGETSPRLTLECQTLVK